MMPSAKCEPGCTCRRHKPKRTSEPIDDRTSAPPVPIGEQGPELIDVDELDAYARRAAQEYDSATWRRTELPVFGDPSRAILRERYRQVLRRHWRALEDREGDPSEQLLDELLEQLAFEMMACIS